MSVGSHVDRAPDFTKYRTHDWGPADALPTGDPRLDHDPFFKDHLQGAVEKQLARKGLERSTSEPADLLIHENTMDPSRPLQRFTALALVALSLTGCASITVSSYVAREFDVAKYHTYDFDRAHPQATGDPRLGWRGWAQGSLDGVIDDQDWMEAKIDEAVTRILERFPRRL